MAKKTKELYLRNDGGIWWFRFTHPLTSKQVRASTKTSNKQEAQKLLDFAKAEAWQQVTDKNNPVSTKRYWIEANTRWMETKITKRSIRTDIQRLNILAPVMELMFLEDITNDFIHEEIVNGLLKKRRVSPATVNRYITLISSILNAAEKQWGWIDRAPYLSKPGASGERQRKAWLTLDQFKRASQNMSPLKSKLMLFSLATGMRLNNIIKLHPMNVDLEKKHIFIPASQFKGRRDHVVPLNKTAINILNQEVGNHKERVFTDKGKPFNSINLRDWHQTFNETGINDELRNTGLLSLDTDDDGNYKEKFIFHGMRHTFATWLGRTGVSLEHIEAICGWSNSPKNKMVNVYTHIDDVTHLLPYVRNIDSILIGEKAF